MFGSVILDVGVGMLLIFSLVALACSGAAEVIEAQFLNRRSKHLRRGVEQLLGSELAARFWDHALVRGSFRKTKAPSYLAPRTAALVLLDIAGNEERVEDLVRSAPKELKAVLVPLARGVDRDMNRLVSAVESWFAQGMERVSGWYKRHVQLVILFLGLLMATLGNIDSLHIARALYADSSLRSIAVAQAEVFSAAVPRPQERRRRGRNTFDVGGQGAVSEAAERLAALDLPIGWERVHDGAAGARVPGAEFWGWLNKIFGIVLTGIAASLGAPFWFDLLGKLVRLRTSLRPQAEAAKASG